MKVKFIQLIVVFLLISNACTQKQATQYVSRQNVENGLTPSILINGEPHWNIIERMAELNIPGLSIAVINNYSVAWSGFYGFANVETKKKVTNQTLFQAASISKPVLALLTLHLVQEGVIDLDRDVNQYLKSWKLPENNYTNIEKVTVRRILSHTAGLSVSGFRGYAENELIPSIRQVLDGLTPSNSEPIRVMNTPGKEYSYSGGGYTVLQMVIEDVTNKPISDLAEEYVFKPAGMKNSTFLKPLPESLEKELAFAHNDKGDAIKGFQFLQHGSGCCGLITTAEDLALFAIELQRAVNEISENIINKEMAELMLTPYNSDFYGLGFSIFNYDGDVYFGHSGSNDPGYSCWLIASKNEGYGLVIMTNGIMKVSIYEEIRRAVAKEYNWSQFQPIEFDSFNNLINDLETSFNSHSSDPIILERRINTIGYNFINMNSIDKAIEIFKLNTKFYPKSANCYDSLAEAYMKNGQNDLAIENYERSLELNPDNANAKEMLKKLKII